MLKSIDSINFNVNIPCMHACLCFHCSKQIAEKQICPVCREVLTSIKHLFIA